MPDCSRPSISGINPVPIVRTPAQIAALVTASQLIQPRLPNGQIDLENGLIVGLGIGMSDAGNIYEGLRIIFRKEMLPSNFNSRFVWVNAAQNGRDSVAWSNPNDICWNSGLATKLQRGNHPAMDIWSNVIVTELQVSFIIATMAVKYPTGGLVATANLFESSMYQTIAIAEQRFPNAQLFFPSCNYYGGYEVYALGTEPPEAICGNKVPEPHQYHQSLRLQSIQDSNLSRCPRASLSPHTNGELPRSEDGLYLRCGMVGVNGVHLNSTLGGPHMGRWLRDWLWAQSFTVNLVSS